MNKFALIAPVINQSINHSLFKRRSIYIQKRKIPVQNSIVENPLIQQKFPSAIPIAVTIGKIFTLSPPSLILNFPGVPSFTHPLPLLRTRSRENYSTIAHAYTHFTLSFSFVQWSAIKRCSMYICVTQLHLYHPVMWCVTREREDTIWILVCGRGCGTDATNCGCDDLYR